ncbi:MAG: hypothetical protein NTY61_02510, partial [Candidatus Parcubacteria bacterium]|nr:hypothetical protein [Candidatus Parcubacteria bacterium]
KKLLADCASLATDVLKVAHHGSKYGSGQDFLDCVKHKLSVISVGKNTFGHPSRPVVKRLESLGIKVLRTDLLGDVEIKSDGNFLKME